MSLVFGTNSLFERGGITRVNEGDCYAELGQSVGELVVGTAVRRLDETMWSPELAEGEDRLRLSGMAGAGGQCDRRLPDRRYVVSSASLSGCSDAYRCCQLFECEQVGGMFRIAELETCSLVDWTARLPVFGWGFCPVNWRVEKTIFMFFAGHGLLLW